MLTTSPLLTNLVSACLVFHDKIKAAMWFLMEKFRGLFLTRCMPNKESTVFDELIKKHPVPSPITPMGFVTFSATSSQSCHPFFDCLDGD